MKWKRSKKAQQEAKEKKSSSSSSSGSTNVPSGGSTNNSEFGRETKTIDKSATADGNILTNNHSSNFHLQKNHGNLDDHRHIVNLAEYSHLDDGVKLNRRPIMFAENNQNGDMFRPYVV